MNYYNVLLAKKTNRVLQFGSLYERLFETWINRARQILKDLPTGAISTVNDAAELPLNALKVSVEAWQEGSGDPSPSNIRPIHGWDSGEITVCDDVQSPTQTETTTLDFPQTIYGAEWDVVGGGGLEDEYFVYEVTSVTRSNSRQFYKSTSTVKKETDYTVMADRIKTATSSSDRGVFVNSSGAIRFNTEDEYATAEEMMQAFGGVIYVRCKKATVDTIPISPLSIRMLEGTNNLYADCGEILSGKYWADV